MPIKFIFDKLQKKQEETIAEILEIVKKKPYPDRETILLAKFTEAMFEAGSKILEEEKKHPKREPEKERPERPKRMGLRFVPKLTKEEVAFIKSLAPTKAVPPPPAMPPVVAPVGKKPEFQPSYSFDVLGTPIDVSIAEDPATKRVKYYLTGPKISLKIVTSVKEELKKDFEKNPKVITDEEKLTKITKKFCEKNKVEFTEDLVKKIKFFLHRDWLGFMKLDPLLRDFNVKSVYCEGADKPVAIEHAGVAGRMETNVMFADNNDINSIIQRVAKKTGNEVTKEKPILNTVYMGVQIQAIIGVGGVSSKLTLKKLE